MKVIIDVPTKEFSIELMNKFQDFFRRVKVEIHDRLVMHNTLLCGAYEIETSEMLLVSFKHAQYIPDNATNGDVLCMLFPNMHYTLSDKSPRVVTTIGIASSFDVDWWNAPYKAESEEK